MLDEANEVDVWVQAGLQVNPFDLTDGQQIAIIALNKGRDKAQKEKQEEKQEEV